MVIGLCPGYCGRPQTDHKPGGPLGFTVIVMIREGQGIEFLGWGPDHQSVVLKLDSLCEMDLLSL